MSTENLREKHQPSEGFDRSEPATHSIWGFTIGSVVLLILVLVALAQYFQKTWNDAVYDKVLAAPSQELQDMRNSNEYALTHYSYEDKSKGMVRIPLERAQELVLQDAAQGKTFYPAKPTKPKTPEEEAKEAAANNAKAGAGKAAADKE